MKVITFSYLHNVEDILKNIPPGNINEKLWISPATEIVSDCYVLPEALRVLEDIVISLGYALCNVTLVLNDTIHIDINTTRFRVIYINFFRLQTYYSKYFTDQEFSSEWNPVNCALFLMGKPYKQHRAPMLYALIQQGVKEARLNYSFHSDPGTKLFQEAACVFNQVYPEVSYAQFSQQYRHTTNHIIPMVNSDGTNFHYSGFPFDPNQYRQTSLSVISETDLDHKTSIDHYTTAWNTEKTWRAIANHHPFTLVSHQYLPKMLLRKGYEIWDRFFKYTHEVVLTSETVRGLLEKSAENVDYFLDVCWDNQDTIQVLTKHNADLMDQHCRGEIASGFNNDIGEFKEFMSRAMLPNLDGDVTLQFRKITD